MVMGLWCNVVIKFKFILLIIILLCKNVSCNEQDRVISLPGQKFEVDLVHYSGYVTVDEDFGRAFYYWFIEAVDNPSTKPLLLWLNGGPGCSSITLGEADEVGPFHIHNDGKSLYLNPYSVNNVANVLFLDAPVGVGFSYSNTSSDFLTNGDKRTAQDSLKFLLGWFERFPQYKGRDFYISGLNYGGHYVPQLSQAIVRYNMETDQKTINLKGYIVGNALTDDFHDHLGMLDYMSASGLITNETYKQINTFCDLESFVNSSEHCNKFFDNVVNRVDHTDFYSIYSPCNANSSESNRLLKRLISPRWFEQMVGQFKEEYDFCTEKHSVAYFNQPEVQEALHINPHFASSKRETCSDIMNNWQDSPRSVLDIYRELIGFGLRIWMFSVDTGLIPVTSTRRTIDALKLPTKDLWHVWRDGQEVGGWVREYEGLTFVVVNGEVPLLRPKFSLAIIKSFLASESMKSDAFGFDIHRNV